MSLAGAVHQGEQGSHQIKGSYSHGTTDSRGHAKNPGLESSAGESDVQLALAVAGAVEVGTLP